MRTLGLVLIATTIMLREASAAPRRDMWVTAYYAGWRQSHLKAESIDFGAVTHLIHFGIHPRHDGTLDSEINLLTPANIASAVSAARRAGVKILFAVGGKATRPLFTSAMSDAHRAAFIDNLVAFLKEHGYDGIDVDMEDILPSDSEAYARFIKELRARLDQIQPRPLLTAAALWEPGVFARLAGCFDQINLMTYALSGAYPGWITWHSGPVYDGGHRFPNGRARLPSTDSQVNAFLAAGVPKSKLGIGLSFYGYVWGGGVHAPRQGWDVPPVIKVLPYYRIAEIYRLGDYGEASPFYRWDPEAQASYLSIGGPVAAQREFVSYENEAAAERKVAYVREKGLGGMIIWELGGGFRPDQRPGSQDPLLKAVKRAVARARRRNE